MSLVPRQHAAVELLLVDGMPSPKVGGLCSLALNFRIDQE